jgi:hypothetical protein
MLDRYNAWLKVGFKQQMGKSKSQKAKKQKQEKEIEKRRRGFHLQFKVKSRESLC